MSPLCVNMEYSMAMCLKIISIESLLSSINSNTVRVLLWSYERSKVRSQNCFFSLEKKVESILFSLCKLYLFVYNFL